MAESLDRYEECIYLKQMKQDKNKWVVIEADELKGIRISYINNSCNTNPTVTDIRCSDGKLTSMISNLSGWND